MCFLSLLHEMNVWLKMLVNNQVQPDYLRRTCSCFINFATGQLCSLDIQKVSILIATCFLYEN